MDDKKPPLEFANRVIRRFVDNLYGDDVGVMPQDYTAMRVVFRKLGGSWEKVSQGDINHCRKIVQVVQGWGKRQKDHRKVEVGY